MPPPRHKILLRASACFVLLAISLALLTILASQANAQGTTNVQYLFGRALGGPENFGMLQTYTVDPTTGALTLIAPTPPLFRSAVGTGVVNPAGTFLFLDGVNSAGTSVVSVFTIAANGATAELPASPFAGSSAGNALGIAISPDGKFLYVDHETDSEVGVYAIDGGNLILDCHFGPIAYPAELEAKLSRTIGVVESGLFINMATTALIAMADGIKRLDR